MAITVAGTTITFNDGTVQSTAAVGDSREFDGVGSYVVAYLAESPGLTTINQRAYRTRGYTVSGSNLRVNSRASGVISTGLVEAGGSGIFNQVSGLGNNTFPQQATTVTLSGTWRLMSAGVFAQSGDNGYGWQTTIWFPMIWVRIS